MGDDRKLEGRVWAYEKARGRGPHGGGGKKRETKGHCQTINDHNDVRAASGRESHGPFLPRKKKGIEYFTLNCGEKEEAEARINRNLTASGAWRQMKSGGTKAKKRKKWLKKLKKKSLRAQQERKESDDWSRVRGKKERGRKSEQGGKETHPHTVHRETRKVSCK